MATKYAGQNALNKLMSLIKNAMPKASTVAPLMDGTAAVGTSNAFARGDHVHPRDTSKLSLSGGTMAGTLSMGGKDITGADEVSSGSIMLTPYTAGDQAPTSVRVKLFPGFERGTTQTVTFAGGVDGDELVEVKGVSTPVDDTDAANKAYVDGKVSGLQNAEQVQAAISAQLGSVYKPMGSCAFDGLPPTAQAQPGWVFNITDAFTTTDAFAEGSGHAYPAGTNIVWIKDQNGVEMWDVLAGTIDLTELTADEVQAIWDSI